MRTVTRAIALLVLTVSLMVSAAVPALAARQFSYRGETSQGTRVRLEVVRKADGRRFLSEFRVTLWITCEDASTERVGFWIGERERLDEDGMVTLELRQDGFFGYAFTLTAAVRRNSAEGTVELITSGLTSDDQAQLCQTGVLDWSAERLRRAGAFAHQGHGLVRLG